MLRPEKMARVSVTGSRGVMPEVIEAVHDVRLLHLTGYDGGWEGFRGGDPIEGADEASEQLVTVRSLKSILGVTGETGDVDPLVADDIGEELEEIRQEVNELDDRRDELRDELRSVEDRIERLEPFAALGIDLDLLSGYDSIAVAVGTGDREAVERTLAEAQVTNMVRSTDDVVAVFARTDGLEDLLVGTAFQAVEIPDASGSPTEYLHELEGEREELSGELEAVESELEAVRAEVGGFLLAAEETLAIEVQRQEAPLDFATTDNAFVAEGWVPYDRYVELYEALTADVGDHVDVDLVEIAEYDGHNTVTSRDDAGSAPGVGDPAVADGGEVATDGGAVSTPMRDDSPPVIQDNPGAVKPFEALVQVINRPKYSELDPTVVFFLTFPAFFGFMIGDLGYGILYMALGYGIMRRFDSDIIRSLGAVALLAGGFTALFGVLYGEFFGFHTLGDIVWAGKPPIHKGLQPHYIAFAKAWLLLSVIVGVLHLVVGRVFDFYQNLEHGLADAVVESGSWILFTVGLWLWVFSRHVPGPKPDFLFQVFASEGTAVPGVLAEPVSADQVAIDIGFSGFPVTVGFIGLAIAAVGLVLIVYEEGGIGLVESITQGFAQVISYTRLAAVLLAKAGMALAVNLLVFGAYAHDGEFHLITFAEAGSYTAEEVIFGGLVNGSGVMLVIGLLAGLLILVLGHLLVLVLGVTSAGLQAVRLEYVEFFSKFYEGGGDAYEPFGHERRYTTDD